MRGLPGKADARLVGKGQRMDSLIGLLFCHFSWCPVLHFLKKFFLASYETKCPADQILIGQSVLMMQKNNNNNNNKQTNKKQ